METIEYPSQARYISIRYVFMLFTIIGLLLISTPISSLAQCTSPINSFPITVDFEDSTLGNWTQDSADDFDWIIDSDGTVSGSTGPSIGNDGSTNYLYVESSNPNYPSKSGSIISPCFTPDASTKIVFAYHMYGVAMGTLTLDVSNDNGATWVNLWSESGDLGDIWNSHAIDLSSYSGQNIQLRFTGQTLNSYTSDFALDDIKITQELIEICGDGIDNDGDLLVDDLDPDCGNFCNVGCTDSYRFDWNDGTSGAQWEITNGETSLTRVYQVSGSKGVYNVSVTLDNPDGQNIDFSNCGTAGAHFYTATCNDPNAATDCDGDVGTTDSQFNYDCGYLTFGITSDNSDQYTSITYDFDFPTQICDLEIGDIDFQGSGSGNTASWQDEVEVFASIDGTPIALSAISGDAVSVLNNNSTNLTLLADFDNTSGGNIGPNDPAGHAYITTLEQVTSLTFRYSNGPDDDGMSDDHAIRVNGFDFCPVDQYEICENGVDDDGNGDIDCDDEACDCTNLCVDPIDESFDVCNTVAFSGDVSSNDSAPSEAFAMTYNVTGQPTKGSVAMNEDGTFTYTSNGVNTGVDNFTYERCYSIKDNVVDDVLVYNPCGTGLTIETFIEGIEGEITPSILISDPANFERVIVEVWAEEVCTSIEIEGVTAQVNSIYRSNGTLEPEKIYRVELTSISSDGLINIVNPDSCPISSVVAYVERLDPSAQGSSILYTSDVDLWRAYVGGDDCITNTLPLGESDAPRDITFTIPLHEKDNTRTVTAEVTAGGISVSGSTSSWSSIGQGAGVITLTLNAVPGDITSATLEVCSPDVNGDSFGIGVITANNPICNEPLIYDCCAIATTTINISDLDASISYLGQPCLDKNNGLQANPIGGNAPYTYSWSGPSFFSSTSKTINPTVSGIYTVTITDDKNCEIILSEELYDSFTPTITTPDNSICPGSSVTLTVSGTDIQSYQWNAAAGGGTTGSVTVSPTSNTIFKVTVTSNEGCIEVATSSITIDPTPTTTITGPDVVCIGQSSTLTASSTGSWTSTNPSVATVDNLGTITALAVGTTSFIFEDGSTLCTSNPTTNFTVEPVPTVSVTGPTSICEGETTTLSPTTGGTWTSSDTNVATVADNGTVTAVGAGTATFVFQSAGTNCTSAATTAITIKESPIVNITGDSEICLGSTTQLSSSLSGGFWTSNNPTVASVSTSGLVTGLSAGSATFFYTSAENCPSSNTEIVTVTGDFSVAVDFNGTVCLTSGSQLTADITGGTPLFTYAWTGPNGFTGNTETINITESGNYALTVTDAIGCTAQTTGFIYSEFEPFIFTLNTEVCEGENVDLSISGNNIVSYQWDANAGNATTQSITVTPSPPSTSYVVTVTNTQGCQSTAEATIDVIPLTIVSITGSDALCIGENSTLSPSSGGEWISTNPAVASVNNSGIVTALSAGSTTFIFKDDITECSSLPTTSLIVKPKTPVLITGPQAICEGFITNLSPTSGGTWSSSDTNVATVTDDGTVTAVGAGVVTFSFLSNATSCASDDTEPVTIYPTPIINVDGNDTICIGSTTMLNSSLSGAWTSSNSSIASVDALGVVTGLGAGTATFSFISANSCAAAATIDILVENQTGVGITGDNILCEGETTTLVASVSGGSWSSSNTTVATINSEGEVLSVGVGNTIITYSHPVQSCSSDATFIVGVYGTPLVNILGSANICVGETSQLNSTIGGGFWTSSDPDVAIVGSTGTVTGVSEGTATFYYSTSQGCISVATGPITVNPAVDVSIDFNGSQCLVSNSSLSALVTGGAANFTYDWSGPGGFTGNTQTINISLNGNYTINITDANGCTATATAFIYESYEPFIFALNTTVCEGEEVTLSVNGSNVAGYEWDTNAGSSTSQSVTVTPVGPSTTYTVTVTNNIGCTTEATAEISVDSKPVISFIGPEGICVGETTQLTTGSAGLWISSNSTVASIDNDGIITGNSAGTATFTFQDGTTGCYSDASTEVTVGANTPVNISGNSTLCFGETTTLTSSVLGGAWTSSSTSIAVVNNLGVVTPVAPGLVTIQFVPSSSDCFSTGTYDMEIFAAPSVSLNGPSTICEDELTYVNASTSGFWTSSDETVATVSALGVIQGLSSGSVVISFESVFGCDVTLAETITIIGKAQVSLDGPSSICLNETTALLPNSGGIWISSNSNVANVNSSGVVTGINPGSATFTFIESTNGCVSDDNITVTVDPRPSISGLTDNILCIGESTTIFPSSGGTWSSTDEAVATINSQGIIKAVGAGSARFMFTNDDNGCTSVLSLPLSVNGKPSINFTGPTTICIDEITSITPATGGQWTSTDVSVATITNQGLITGISPGEVSFIFTNNSTGCSSDASSTLTIDEPTPIVLTGLDRLCIGEKTAFTPSNGGIWTSSNPTVASIDNNGIVTAIAPGTANFTFDSFTSCNSNSSIDITIDPSPVVSYNGPNNICEGTTTNLFPSTGGVWTSSDTSVATVDANGLVNGISAGTAEFSFTDGVTGCVSNTPSSLTVYSEPTIAIAGDDEICIGFSTFMTPNTGGIWTSSNITIATISSSGQVTGISSGTVTFTFYETGSSCVSEPSAPISVVPNAPVAITGDNTICVGSQTTVSPTTGGSWVSNNPSVATIDDSGNVTGVSQGIAKFTFISSEGCLSNETSPVIVYGPPTVSISGPSTICIGGNSQLLPSSGGVWTSLDETVATVSNEGLVTGVSSGNVSFIFTDENTGCISNATDLITVSPPPNTGLNGANDICIGGTTNLTPSSGGVWTSIDPGIASIQNNGLVTGISVGQARFLFTQLSTGCVSDTTDFITVNGGPDISFSGPMSICVGDVTTLTPSTGGTWSSTNIAIANITNDGVVTAFNPGVVKFQFTETSTGCISSLSEALTVNGPPTAGIAGSPLICIGSTTQLVPSTGGNWASLNTEIATVTNDGVVSGVSEGEAFFVYTDNMTGCSSDGSLSITVSSSVNAQITGESEICIGYTTTLSPSSGGIWTSSNPEIATVSNFGVVTGKAPGIVTFSFVDSDTGCSTDGTTDPVTVGDCLNNDFNVALVDQIIYGNLSTNDHLVEGSTYSNIKITIEKPLASIPQLTINLDGTYSFSTNKPGKYLYKISACVPTMLSGCPSALLEINVLEDVYGNSNPLTNLEFITTYTNADNALPGNSIVIDPLANDKCVYTAGCSLDPTSLSITSAPSNGTTQIDIDGKITYTPNAGFIGFDTIEYTVCVLGDLSNCSSSNQVITVNHTSALNSVDAADDFTYTLREINVTGNVMSNDSDPENDVLAVVPEGTLMAPISIPEGEYYIEANGEYSFTPNAEFSGAVEIVYTVCDDNSSVTCSKATLHIQVFDDLSIVIKVYLEGALSNNGNMTGSDGRPLMRDDLRVNPFTGENNIPTQDPYSFAVDAFDNTPSKFSKIGPGLLPINLDVTDSLDVFSVSGENAIVDWVFVEVRDKNLNTNVLATRSGLLQRDGDVVDLDGVSPLRFEGLNVDSFYVCIKHRNHLGAMTLKVKNGDVVDFTDEDTPLFNFGTSLNNSEDYTGLSVKYNYKNGYSVLWAGDMNSDGKIKFTEPASDQNILFGDVLFNSPDFLINYDNAYGYFRGDFNMNGKAKYTNPNDDKNLLFTQLLLYPLNGNYIANYGNLLEQVPK